MSEHQLDSTSLSTMWYITLLIASCIPLCYAGQPLPPYIKPCARSDPNINECALKHGNEAIPELVKGDRKYKIPVLDPFDIKELKIIDDGSRASGISITLKNAKVYGIKDSQLKKASIHLDQNQNYFDMLVPKVHIVGEYESSGRILLLPISGKGNVSLTIENIYVVYYEHWQSVPKNGEMYLTRDNLTTTSKTPTGFHIQLTNLFNGNKLLGDQMNEFLNENWRDAYNELSPTIFKIISEILVSVVSRISSVVPYENIYPEKLPS